MLIIKKADKSDFKKIHKLYVEAFPKEERCPFFFLKHRAVKGKGELLSVYSKEADKETFIAMVSILSNDEIAYLFFFAIQKEYRGKEYGSQILKMLPELYEGKKLFLAREQLDDNAENNAQRIRRHNFYLRNGFEDWPLLLQEASVIYDAMGIGSPIEPEEYEKLLTNWGGRLYTHFIKIKGYKKE
ncbi:MAG: GNAT family N-acetyltransferase [Lachnospiraceae bacterium]|nr:GNAT family N-acetyltransferase [Lachnospiraceae bacterium]